MSGRDSLRRGCAAHMSILHDTKAKTDELLPQGSQDANPVRLDMVMKDSGAANCGHASSKVESGPPKRDTWAAWTKWGSKNMSGLGGSSSESEGEGNECDDENYVDFFADDGEFLGRAPVPTPSVNFNGSNDSNDSTGASSTAKSFEKSKPVALKFSK